MVQVWQQCKDVDRSAESENLTLFFFNYLIVSQSNPLAEGVRGTLWMSFYVFQPNPRLTSSAGAVICQRLIPRSYRATHTFFHGLVFLLPNYSSIERDKYKFSTGIGPRTVNILLLTRLSRFLLDHLDHRLDTATDEN